jgi:hypothetical protein
LSTIMKIRREPRNNTIKQTESSELFEKSIKNKPMAQQSLRVVSQFVD